MLIDFTESKTFRLSAKIGCRLFLGLSVFLAVVAVILTAVALNRAPYNQFVRVWLSVTIAYYAVFVLLVVGSLLCYPKGTIIEHARPTLSDADIVDPVDPDSIESEPVSTKSRCQCSRGEIVVSTACFIMTSVCLLIMTAFMFPEAYHPTRGLRVQRLGSVSSSSARILLRDSSKNKQHRLYYREASSNKSFNEVAFEVDPELDYTRFLTLNGLSPSTTYSYRFDDGPLNNFTTAPLSGSSNAFSFYFGSCFLYNYPNFKDASGWRYVDELLSAVPRDPTKGFIAFLGDFIYSDHPWYRGSGFSTYASE